MIVFKSIKNNFEFLNVYHRGKSYANRYLVMYITQNQMSENRYGITVSKKVGNSVVRHRVTRLIRESIRLNEEQFARGYDIVVVARNTAKDKKYQDIESALLHLGKIHKIVNKKD
ncbi:MAG: ribonuclease P protein component [Lachnospiraceae bacterium]|nr:ribonuclease P protein component [Lachnospiraceae bacterium]MBQ2320418.1 ribonuclease P protein component [Lachnospiraceae bacterium]